MPVTPDSVVTIHYTLRDDAGTVLDSSSPQAPLAYLHGHGNLIPGLEKELDRSNADIFLSRGARMALDRYRAALGKSSR